VTGANLNSSTLNFGWFLAYKFFNSLFLGLSIGAVFTLYEPLSPATFSAGGVGLALATMVIATQYHRIFDPWWFFRLSLGVEVVILLGVIGVLIYPIEQPLSLFIYLGYQVTFALGSYLVRCETLLVVEQRRLTQLDVTKQIAYLIGMGASWAAYLVMANHFVLVDKAAQVVAIHGPLLVVEAAVIACLVLAFSRAGSRES
jgi:putative membrane protein